MPAETNRFARLLTGNIVGVVDSYGSVRSEFTADRVAFHEEFFGPSQCKWRWDHGRGIWWISPEHRPDGEQEEAIRRHLSRKYGLRWWDNGHHDIEHLLKKAKG